MAKNNTITRPNTCIIFQVTHHFVISCRGRLRGLTGSALDYRSLPPEFERGLIMCTNVAVKHQSSSSRHQLSKSSPECGGFLIMPTSSGFSNILIQKSMVDRWSAIYIAKPMQGESMWYTHVTQNSHSQLVPCCTLALFQ